MFVDIGVPTKDIYFWSIAFILGSGIILACIRLSDPFYVMIFREQWQAYFGKDVHINPIETSEIDIAKEVRIFYREQGWGLDDTKMPSDDILDEQVQVINDK